MNTPLLTAPEPESNYSPCPEGNHIARCFQIIDLGTRNITTGNFPGLKREVQFLFETPYETSVFDESKGQQPYYVRLKHTLYMTEKSNLRKMIQSWLGKKFTEEEAKYFNIFSLIGMTCQVNVVHSQKGTKTYANIVSVTPMAKGMNCPDAINPLLCYTPVSHDQEAFSKLPSFIQDEIKTSEEFKNYMAQGMESMPPAQPQRTSLPSGAQPPSSYNPAAKSPAKTDSFLDELDNENPPF